MFSCVSFGFHSLSHHIFFEDSSVYAKQSHISVLFIECIQCLYDKISPSPSCQSISGTLCKHKPWGAPYCFLSALKFNFKSWVHSSCAVGVHNSVFVLQNAFLVFDSIDSLGVPPLLILSFFQFSLRSVRRAATPSSRTPTEAPPSAPAGCSSRPCRTSSATTPSLRAGTSFRSLTSRPACPPSVWRWTLSFCEASCKDTDWRI